ncbi:MAG: hypothetical protein DRJ39_01165 [Thermoprotei archaeon]|nr:MAG: hypothetical protein DRJ39_01165 [Thermoprotei archaeon]
MRVLIFSLGFDISGVVSALTSMPLKSGDELVFVIPRKDNERSIRARGEIENFLRLLSTRGLRLNYRYLMVNEENIEDILKELFNLITNSSGDIYIEATGGVRSIVVAMTIAAIIFRDKIKEFHTIAETTGNRVKVPLVPYDIFRLDKVDRQILKLAFECGGVITTPYIEEQLEIPKSTATRRLHKLREKGLLIQIAKKPARFSLTSIGEFLSSLEVK